MDADAKLRLIGDQLADLTAILSEEANRRRLGLVMPKLPPPPAVSASAVVVNSNTALIAGVGILVAFALVAAIAAVLIVAAWRSADARVFAATAAAQAATNENLSDRLALQERITARMEREKNEGK